MAHVVVMPRMGQGMEAGEIIAWLKAPGDLVSQGEILLTIQSEKAELEVEADYSGVLAVILATPEDGEIECLAPIAIIAEPGEEVDVAATLADYIAKRGA